MWASMLADCRPLTKFLWGYSTLEIHVYYGSKLKNTLHIMHIKCPSALHSACNLGQFLTQE